MIPYWCFRRAETVVESRDYLLAHYRFLAKYCTGRTYNIEIASMSLIVEYLPYRALLTLPSPQIEDKSLLSTLTTQFQIGRSIRRIHRARTHNSFIHYFFLGLGYLLAHPLLILIRSLCTVLPVTGIQIINKKTSILFATLSLDCFLHRLQIARGYLELLLYLFCNRAIFALLGLGVD